ncbi:hypothetical protein [Fidelibacter multiformis]|uniref:hypothetical protein n=1 Tax=Fidelibacter multiformis TaxID=3377529 RepID=UPI0037DC4BB7
MDLNTAQQHLNTERSEVLEHHEMGFERRQALEYHTAVHEHHEVAFNNSSGTSCRSIASLRSAFQHCFAVFKKEIQSPIEFCKAGIEDRMK